MKISFFLDWEMKEASQLATAEDGMWEAVRIIAQNHNVTVYVNALVDGIIPHKYFPIVLKPQKDMAQTILGNKPDMILVWGDMTRPTIPQLLGKGIPVRLAFTGGIGMGTPDPRIEMFYVESKSYYDWFSSRGFPVKIAFGVNDRIFKPMKQPKIFDVGNFSTFAAWKRHKLLAEATEGLKVLCGGYMYEDHEVDCWGIPQQKGCAITHHLPSNCVNDFINMCKCIVLTSNTHGGSQRSVLEAMACNIPVIVMSDSDKTSEYVRESGAGIICEPNTESIQKAVEEALCAPDDSPLRKGRKYIERKWTAQHYADSLLF